jgi:hypothetical protein
MFQRHGYELADKLSYRKVSRAVVDGFSKQSPGSTIGKGLIKFGKFGKVIRRWMLTFDVKYQLYTNLFILRVKGK